MASSKRGLALTGAAPVAASTPAASTPAAATPAAAPTAAAPESTLDDLLTPMERNVKTYLTNTLSKDLVEILAVLAVERPVDAHLWLASKLLERAPTGPFIAVRAPVRAGKTVASTPTAAGGAAGGGAASATPTAAATDAERDA